MRALRFMRGFVVKGCHNKPFTRALKDEGNCLLDHRESSSEVYGKQSAPGPGHFTNFFFAKANYAAFNLKSDNVTTI